MPISFRENHWNATYDMLMNSQKLILGSQTDYEQALQTAYSLLSALKTTSDQFPALFANQLQNIIQVYGNPSSGDVSPIIKIAELGITQFGISAEMTSDMLMSQATKLITSKDFFERRPDASQSFAQAAYNLNNHVLDDNGTTYVAHSIVQHFSNPQKVSRIKKEFLKNRKDKTNVAEKLLDITKERYPSTQKKGMGGSFPALKVIEALELGTRNNRAHARDAFENICNTQNTPFEHGSFSEIVFFAYLHEKALIPAQDIEDGLKQKVARMWAADRSDMDKYEKMHFDYNMDTTANFVALINPDYILQNQEVFINAAIERSNSRCAIHEFADRAVIMTGLDHKIFDQQNIIRRKNSAHILSQAAHIKKNSSLAHSAILIDPTEERMNDMMPIIKENMQGSHGYGENYILALVENKVLTKKQGENIIKTHAKNKKSMSASQKTTVSAPHKGLNS